MKIYVNEITTEDQRTMGGWGSYCNFVEITNERGDVLAQVNEEDGTVVLPQQSEGKWYFKRDYRNQVIPITLLSITDSYVLVRVHNLHGTVKKLYYFDKEDNMKKRCTNN